jgi:hypothetical protein
VDRGSSPRQEKVGETKPEVEEDERPFYEENRCLGGYE